MQQQHLAANTAERLQCIGGDKSVNHSLVFCERALAVESPPTVLNTAEEGHLLRGTVQRTMHLALVTHQIALVLKAATAILILAHVPGNVISRIPVSAAVIYFKVRIRQ